MWRPTANTSLRRLSEEKIFTVIDAKTLDPEWTWRSNAACGRWRSRRLPTVRPNAHLSSSVTSMASLLLAFITEFRLRSRMANYAAGTRALTLRL
jgi:hypothetical protein